MLRWIATFTAVVFLAVAQPACAAEEPIGWLKIAKKSPQGKIEHALIPYMPREGDLVFYDDHSIFWTALFLWVGSGPPLHMGIVVKKTDGRFAVLEAGPDDSVHVALLDLRKRLPQFDEDFHGTIEIRRCKKVLTKEQSADLTKFAQAQNGKRYAVGRLLLEGTCLRVRGPIRELLFGHTYLDRDAWICSELAVSAAARVKLLDPKSIAANATYPSDIVDNRRHDLSASWHDAAPWVAKK